MGRLGERIAAELGKIGFVPAVLALALLASCTERTSKAKAFVSAVGTSARVAPTTSDARVVLITIDGARWQDVFGGSDEGRSGAPHVPPELLMPRVYGLLADHGVAFGADREGCGTVHTASGANVSLPGYQEIFTGRPSYCLDNNCDGVSESVLDEAACADVAGVASIGSWDVLDRAVSGGGAGVLVAVGRSWPAEVSGASIGSTSLDGLVAAGLAADPYPGHDGYRPDVHTAAIALEYFRAAKPAFLHIGLGDTDELGHRDDYPGYLVALRNADALIGAIADEVAQLGELGAKTTILVTPDHGRNSDFRDHGTLRVESGRTFLLAFGAGVAARGIGCPAHDLTLADVAPTIRVRLGLPRDIGDGAGTPINLLAPGTSAL
jgi:hypothetical protein